MELKNINEVTATEVLKLAVASLWDGTATYGRGDRFCCLAVTTAIEKITGLSWGEANNTALAVNLRKSILGKLDGHSVAEGYLQAQRKLGSEDVPLTEVQEFRKELLVKLADELCVNEQVKEQIRILKAVRVMRTDGSPHSQFVCWNVDEVLEDCTTPAGTKIKRDIDQYIDGELTVRTWLCLRDNKEYENYDQIVLDARIKMVDDLLARYRAELAA